MKEAQTHKSKRAPWKQAGPAGTRPGFCVHSLWATWWGPGIIYQAPQGRTSLWGDQGGLLRHDAPQSASGTMALLGLTCVQVTRAQRQPHPPVGDVGEHAPSLCPGLRGMGERPPWEASSSLRWLRAAGGMCLSVPSCRGLRAGRS